MKHWKQDALLIGILLILAAALWLFLHPGAAGAYAVVTLHGREIVRYSLSENGSYTIGDEEYNTLVIENGEAYINDANCGDHTCIRTGRISLEGERIICLPHELIVEIIGGESSELDAATH